MVYEKELYQAGEDYRHINYLGEYTSICISASRLFNYRFIYTILYPIYYILLFVPRQIDDDKICEENIKMYGMNI